MEAYIGQIFLVPFSSVPDGALPCDGRTLLISGNNVLYSLLGARFGGNGTTTFAVPDLRSITPPGMMYAIVVSGYVAQRP